MFVGLGAFCWPDGGKLRKAFPKQVGVASLVRYGSQRSSPKRTI